MAKRQNGKGPDKRTIYCIADFGVHDLAYAEVAARFAEVLPDARLFPVNVPPFSTLAAGFCVAQLTGEHRLRGGKDAVFVNVDPRTHTPGHLDYAQGAPFVCVRLANGVQVFGPAAGYALSWLKNSALARWFLLHDGDGMTQFRSRDVFPGFIADVLNGSNGSWPAFDPRDIASPPQGPVLLYEDGYGNLKINLREGVAKRAGFEPGRALRIFVGRNPRCVRAVCARTIMGVRPGEIALAPGSSGYPGDRYMELAVRAASEGARESAASRLGGPAVGTPIRIEFLAERQARA